MSYNSNYRVHSYDIVGYAVDGDEICCDCATEEETRNYAAIFAGEETDIDHTCCICHEVFLEQNLFYNQDSPTDMLSSYFKGR